MQKRSFGAVLKVLLYLWILSFICFAAFCIWGWRSGYIQGKYEKLKTEYHNTMGNIGFVLNDILIQGRVRTPKTDITHTESLRMRNIHFIKEVRYADL